MNLQELGLDPITVIATVRVLHSLWMCIKNCPKLRKLEELLCQAPFWIKGNVTSLPVERLKDLISLECLELGLSKSGRRANFLLPLKKICFWILWQSLHVTARLPVKLSLYIEDDQLST
ncbi:uncharacterized protein A4U43_UnF5120 [Asparagus officinalis]|uniref:Uncharacterized protein n=1 Tax=Asparagus officinalis TaxID=4686 RepID=A0A1R3L6R4_ASPOF|nr:uncharacterized protein A4U43_UnF5120 [Asparagus officinalis]